MLSSLSDESCDFKNCTHRAICKVTNGKAECSCDLSCSDTSDPVCGSDGKNYDNKCNMNETACKERKIITILKRGKCGMLICYFTLDIFRP